MHLEKFYVDVVSTDGSGCIGYAARLDGFGLATTMAATLRWTGATGPHASQLRTVRGTMPIADSRGVTWRCPALGVAGTWRTRQPPEPERILWGDARGAVRWCALAPRAEVEVQLGERTITGLGYAERLSLDLPPWRLPIDVLRWGRFVSAAHSAVWIEWQQTVTRRWLWHNGAEVSPAGIGDSGVAWPGHRLEFGAPRTLRSGRLAETAFARWPGVRRWLPRPLQSFDESKWCAPGTLHLPGGAEDRGWAIYERVSFR